MASLATYDCKWTTLSGPRTKWTTHLELRAAEERAEERHDVLLEGLGLRVGLRV